MKISEMKFDLDDIAIVPSVISDIGSRSQCDISDPYFGKGFLPLMAAPMDTVVCSENINRYLLAGIIPCIPRGKTIEKIPVSGNFFTSFGLSEIEDHLRKAIPKEDDDLNTLKYILIDIANGHMQRLIDVIKELKSRYPNIKIMAGNVAHPLTYKNLSMAGADYVRCSIGTGAGCTTAANVAINYPMGSLISECYKIKIESDLDTKIVADGGIRGFSDIIKAIALGADYVMMGSVFNKCMESSGFNYLKTSFIRKRIRDYDLARKLWKWGFPIYKKYRGMSTKSVQRSWGRAHLVTAEGITKYQKVEYTLFQWVSNFKDYMKSVMSYTNSKNLEEFKGEAEWVFITERAMKRFEK